MNMPTDFGFTQPDVFNLTRESVIVRDAVGRVLAWNRAAELLYGWSAGEMVGRVADEMLRSSPPVTIAAGAGAELWSDQIVRVGRNRNTLLIDAQFSVQRRDQNGAPVEIVEISQLISGARTASSLEGEHRYRTLFHAMPTSFLELDITGVRPILAEFRDCSIEEIRSRLHATPATVERMMRATRVVDVNEHAIETFGDGDRTGMLDCVAPFWPIESYGVYVDSLIARLTETPRFTRETTMTTLRGRPVHAIFTASLDPRLVGNGRVIIGIVDVTALTLANLTLAESRERYRAIFHRMPMPLFRLNGDAVSLELKDFTAEQRDDPEAVLRARPQILDHVMRTSFIEEANLPAARLLGVDDPEQLIGLPGGPLLASRPDSLRRLALASIQSVSFEEETQITTPQGRVLDVLLTMNFINENGRRFSLAGMIDVTDRRKTEADLAALQADFAHAARISMLGELAASIAHEVNQPLAAIGASGEAGMRWLDRDPPNLDRVRNQLTRLVGQAERASRIIERIRGAARSSAPERQSLDMSKVAQNALGLVEHQARAMRVTLDLRVMGGPFLVMADRTQLEQVIANLVINAMQAIAAGEAAHGHVVVGIGGSDGYVECSVVDDGPGLEPHVERRLFDSFFTTKKDGMGLGLSVCRSIVQSLGGSLTAENRSDAPGARFIFRVPRAAAGDG
ncbi:PAS domain-containing protein [Bradyrhizobium yuanmingense]|uniref:histidine kinase n=1 Tax=Bradyrhizobium yuanmingense TaxID=108015 RepID=A0A1C3VI43_9BRAD|nr:PAS domain-containing protein [Bradyrhizobium yuanmingense]SCB27443.1 PAS domain-containing protein [Bradyrhizobium yuanmingense]